MGAPDPRGWLAQEQVDLASTMYDSAWECTRRLAASMEAWAERWREEDGDESGLPDRLMIERENQMLELADDQYRDYVRFERARDAFLSTAPRVLHELSTTAPPDPLGGHRPVQLSGVDVCGRDWTALACLDCGWRWIHRSGVDPDEVARRHRAAHLDPPAAAICEKHGFPPPYRAHARWHGETSDEWPPPAMARGYLWHGRHGPWPIALCAECLAAMQAPSTADEEVHWDGRVDPVGSTGYANAVQPAPWSDPQGDPVPDDGGRDGRASTVEETAAWAVALRLGATPEALESLRERAVEPSLTARALTAEIDLEQLALVINDGCDARSYVELIELGSTPELARDLARSLSPGVLPVPAEDDLPRKLSKVRPRTHYSLRDYLHLREGLEIEALDHQRALSVVDAGVHWLHYTVARRRGRTHEAALTSLAARGAENLVDRSGDLSRMRRVEESAATYEHLIARYGDVAATPIRQQVASAILNRARDLSAVGHHEQALEVNARAIDIAESLGHQGEARATAALATNNEGSYLYRLGRVDEALRAYDRTVDGYSRDEDEPVVEEVLRALAGRGSILLGAGRYAEALDAFDRIVAVADAATFSFSWWRQRAGAYLDRGVVLARLDRHDEAIASYELLLEHVGQDWEARVLAAKARINIGITESEMDRFDDALETFDRVIEDYGGDRSTDIQHQVAKAFVGRAAALGRLGRRDEQRRAYDDVLSRFGTNDVPDIRAEMVRASVGIAVSWGEQGRREEELAAYQAALSRYGDDSSPLIRAQLSPSYLRLSQILNEAGRPADVVGLSDRYLQLYGEDRTASAREGCAVMLIARGIAMGSLGRAEDQLDSYREVVRRYQDDPALAVQVAWARFDEGLVLHNASRWEDALASYSRSSDGLPADLTGELALVDARSALNRGMVLVELGRIEPARDCYSDVVDRHRDNTSEAVVEIVSQARTYLAQLVESEQET